MKLQCEPCSSSYATSGSKPPSILTCRVVENFKPAIQKVHNALQKSKQARQQHDQSIAERVDNRFEALDDDIELLTEAATEPNMGKLPNRSPISPTRTKKSEFIKRKASKPIDVSDRAKLWNAIKQQQYRLHNDVQDMLAKQRRVNRIVSAYHNQYENSPPPEGIRVTGLWQGKVQKSYSHRLE